MRIVTGAIVTETNTFSPIPTGLQAFELHGIQHGSREPIRSTNELATLVRWRELAQEEGHTIVESLGAVAEPGGRTVRWVYEAFRDELLADVRAAMPVDVVLLYLHGAMVAQGYDDCEGDILARVREVVGAETVVGAELDPHSHLTQAMLEQASVLVTYDEYPHTDIVERGEDLYRLCTAAARKELRPFMRAFDCRMVGLFPTTAEPMRSFVDRLKAARNGDVLSTSLVHGFPWGDVSDAGTKCLAVTNGDATLAQQTADSFGRQFFSMREAVQLAALSVDQALDIAVGSPAVPVVIADVADNAGGGAPGDSTFLLRRIVERGIADVVTGIYYDPVAVEMCFEAGEGAQLDLRLGGKLGPASGDPLDLRVTIRALQAELAQDSMDDSAPVPLGRAAWVEASGVQIALASIRCQVFAPNAFTALGIPLHLARIIVVKSSHHFWGKFAPLAGAVVYANSPGALQTDFAAIPYTKRDRTYWPRVAEPFA